MNITTPVAWFQGMKQNKLCMDQNRLIYGHKGDGIILVAGQILQSLASVWVVILTPYHKIFPLETDWFW